MIAARLRRWSAAAGRTLGTTLAENSAVQREPPGADGDQDQGDTEVDSGQFPGCTFGANEGVAAHDDVEMHGDRHRAKDTQCRQWGDQTEDQRQPATEFRDGRQCLEYRRRKAVWAHPARGIPDLEPAMHHEG